MSDQPPIIPNYQLLHPIGAGSSSNVWLAKDQYGESRAIKVMRDEYIGDYHYQRRLEREVSAQQTLYDITSHVPRIFHYDATHHPPYIVMDFVDGSDLNRMIAKGEITSHSLVSRLKWIEALSVTLAKAHSIKVSPTDSHGLIHRDIKPSNIRLQGERLYLLDFSISLPSDVEIDNTQTAMTIRYSAPEGIASEASDIFSLGLVAYEILYEIHPFTTMQEADSIPINLYHDYLVQKLIDKTWRLPGLNTTQMLDLEKPEVKARLDEVFEKVFALNSSDRYQTPMDFYHDLWSAIYPDMFNRKPEIAPDPVSTKIFPELTSNPLTATLIFLKSSNRQTIGFMIALILILGIMAYTTTRQNDSETAGTPTPDATVESSPTLETPIAQALVESATLNPSKTSTSTPRPSSTQKPTSTPKPTVTPSRTSTSTPRPSSTLRPTSATLSVALSSPTFTLSYTPTATAVVVTLSANKNFASQILSQSTPAPDEATHWGIRTIRAETTSQKRMNLDLLYVPSGCYVVDKTEEACIESGFWIDSLPVSNALYDLCLSEAQCRRPAFGDVYDPAGALSTQSVVGINWFMAQTYCLWRNGRLPTEQEWDYAMTHLSSSATKIEEWVSTLYTSEYGTGNPEDDYNAALEILQKSSNVDVVVKQVLRNRLLRHAEKSANLAENLGFRCIQEFDN